MNIQVDSTSSNLASAMLDSKIMPRAVVGYGVKIFHPSPPNYVTRSPGIICNTKALFQVASNLKWALIVWKLNWRERIRNLGTREIENVVDVLTSHRTSNLAIFQCCFTADNKEMYQNEKHHSRGVPSVQTSLLLLVKYIDLWARLRRWLPSRRLAATSEAGTVYSRDLIELIMKIFFFGWSIMATMV